MNLEEVRQSIERFNASAYLYMFQGRPPMMALGWPGPYLSMSMTITAEFPGTYGVQKNRIRDSRILFIRHPFPRAHSARPGAQACQKFARRCPRFRLGDTV